MKTDTNGNYNMILLPGTYNVTYSNGSYQPKTLTVEITETDKTVNQDLALTPL